MMDIEALDHGHHSPFEPVAGCSRCSGLTVREYRLCVEYGDGRVVYKPLPPKISKSAAFTHAANYSVGKSGVTVSVESRVVSAWRHESLALHKRDR